MARDKRYKKRVSDRSGFDYLERELVRDEGSLVGPDEFDTPPPSKKSTGSEGEISPGDTRINATTSYQTPSGLGFSVQYLTSSNSISFVTGVDESGNTNPNLQWVYIVGSNSEVTLASNPQITAGYQNAQFTVQCVGSSITLVAGSGLSLLGAKPFRMTSGSVITLFYSQTDNLWYETNRMESLW